MDKVEHGEIIDGFHQRTTYHFEVVITEKIYDFEMILRCRKNSRLEKNQDCKIVDEFYQRPTYDNKVG